nr:LTA synthase family protein [candidate division Zixibacteria bacterium]
MIRGRNYKFRFVSASAFYILGAALLLLLYSEFWRLLLMVSNPDPVSEIPLSILMQSFIIGARFDFRVIAVVLLPLFLIGTIPTIDISRYQSVRVVNLVLLGVISGVMFFLHLIDIEFYKFFKARLNGSALLWKDSSSDMIKMIWESYPVIRYMLLYLVILVTFIYLAKRLLGLILNLTGPNRGWVTAVYILPVLFILVIGGIGRIYEVSPMRWGMAFFSRYEFANQLTLNPVHEFARDIFYDMGKREQIHRLVEQVEYPEGENTVREMLGMPPVKDGQEEKRLVRHRHFEKQNPDPPNIIVVISESFGSSKIGTLLSEYQYDLTPGFDSLSKKGTLFTNFYSTGTHTCTAMFSVMTGTPHLFGRTMMKQVQGYWTYFSLAAILREKGYETIFCTTQDPHFDNMQGFMRANGVMTVYSVLDHDQSLVLNWLGVPDQVMFDHAYNQLRKRALEGRKFFALILTGTNHPPCEVPEVGIERMPESEPRKNEFDAIRYADWAFSRFFYQIDRDSAFDNTIIFFTADNGFPYNVTTELDVSWIQIPFFVYSTRGEINGGVRNNRLGCQLDILPTVMGRVGLDYDDYSLGYDLFDTTATVEDFAFATSWYNIGFIRDSLFFVSRLNGGPISLYHLSDKSFNIAGEYPEVVAEMKCKVYGLYQSAYYNPRRPLDRSGNN